MIPAITGRSVAALYFRIIKNAAIGSMRYTRAVMQYPMLVPVEKTISFTPIMLFYHGKSLFKRTCRDYVNAVVLRVDS